MDYHWDPGKAKSNLQKHGIAFAHAVSVFQDDSAITIEDDYDNEERFVISGRNALGFVLVVVFTWRDHSIRIISARKATAVERKQYEAYHER